jgi:hypothetical protein
MWDAESASCVGLDALLGEARVQGVPGDAEEPGESASTGLVAEFRALQPSPCENLCGQIER